MKKQTKVDDEFDVLDTGSGAHKFVGISRRVHCRGRFDFSDFRSHRFSHFVVHNHRFLLHMASNWQKNLRRIMMINYDDIIMVICFVCKVFLGLKVKW